MSLNYFFRLSLALLFCASFAQADDTNKFPTQPPVPYHTAKEQAKLFVLSEGYRLELVLSDPIIREPVAAAFDGDGRMYVAEMRTYMQDIDGNNQLTNGGRVSLHWSTRRDGVFNKHTVFADNLILPRMILPLADGVLINETDSNDIWLYRDRNRDGVADEKKKIYAGGSRGGNLEHQQSGLIWNLDNWLYMTINDYRLRLRGTNVLKEETPSSGGQWGMSRDDYGKPWVVNASGEKGPFNFQQNYVYGRFTIHGEEEPGFKEVWPLVGIPDVQGGEHRVRPAEKTLNHMTGTCGGEIFRGDRLPGDLRGDFLFCEPVGRLIRRAKVDVKDGVTYLRNAYEKSEFIRSKDPNFRPVNIATAPDGTLYIMDMYRGIIQEANWVKEDSYLRKVVKQYSLDKNFGRGRIWRLVHEDFKPAKRPRLQNEKPSKLVKYLEHPNGWHRDTAQKLLILRKDWDVVPALVDMALANTNHLARIHAIWTLEGLESLGEFLVREKLRDAHPQVRIAAIRASESLYKNENHSLVPDIEAMVSDSDPNVVIQVMLTAKRLGWKNYETIVTSAMRRHSALGVQEIGRQLDAPEPAEPRQFTDAQKKLLKRGENIYNDLCFACHGANGRGAPLQGAPEGTLMAPPLAGSKTVTGLSDGILAVLLKGLTGPVNEKTYDSQMVSMESNDDEWIEAISSYVRNNFGNNASFIRSNDVARVRSTLKGRQEPWTLDELAGIQPQFMTNRAQWKVSASHNSGAAIKAVDDKRDTRYDTGKEQTPGMWFQVELPEETKICGVYLDAASSNKDYPREFKVDVSTDGKSWSEPVATGEGDARTTETQFSPVAAKFVRITQTGKAAGLWWSIHDLHVLQPPDEAKVAAALEKKAAASSFE